MEWAAPEKAANGVFVFRLAQKQKADSPGRQKGRDEQIVVLVDRLEKSLRSFPLHLVHQIERGMQDKLRHMLAVLLRRKPVKRQKGGK